MAIGLYNKPDIQALLRFTPESKENEMQEEHIAGSYPFYNKNQVLHNLIYNFLKR